MNQTIFVTETVMNALKALEGPFKDSPSEVIERLLDFYHKHTSKNGAEEVSTSKGQAPRQTQSFSGPVDFSGRERRQRGGVVKVNGFPIAANSIHDLYVKVLTHLHSEGHMQRIQQDLPIANGAKRYLLSRKPIHKNGKRFYRPAKYREYFMEAHWSWADGVRYLRHMLQPYGISVE